MPGAGAPEAPSPSGVGHGGQRPRLQRGPPREPGGGCRAEGVLQCGNQVLQEQRVLSRPQPPPSCVPSQEGQSLAHSPSLPPPPGSPTKLCTLSQGEVVTSTRLPLTVEHPPGGWLKARKAGVPLPSPPRRGCRCGEAILLPEGHLPQGGLLDYWLGWVAAGDFPKVTLLSAACARNRLSGRRAWSRQVCAGALWGSQPEPCWEPRGRAWAGIPGAQSPDSCAGASGCRSRPPV